VRDFSSTPGLADCVRLTVGTPEENDEVVAAVRSILSEV
jgi:histidinol-phosphate aminotransferase